MYESDRTATGCHHCETDSLKLAAFKLRDLWSTLRIPLTGHSWDVASDYIHRLQDIIDKNQEVN